ncbi:hypothetical protein HanRHA438_Chr13g0585631 [Helianthus annuus]|nr:hypothetical protein HanRHA438_Chr13g0585631 [Helianthus annuus]
MHNQTQHVLQTCSTSTPPVECSSSNQSNNQPPTTPTARKKTNSQSSTVLPTGLHTKAQTHVSSNLTGTQARHTLVNDFQHIIHSTAVVEPSTPDDPYNFVYEGLPTSHRLLKENTPCPHCAAKRFTFEFPTFCCMDGKTVLAYTGIPQELHHLYTSQENIGRVFRENIRAYNTNFSFTSMGVSLDETMANMRGGVYTFRAHKGIYHRIDQLVSRDGTPRYLQLYFYDPDTELQHRLRWPNLDADITRILTHTLSTNPYVQTFRRLAELGPLDNYRVTLNAALQLDQRVYNRPTTSEVAGIWVEGNENTTSYKRSIIVYGRSDHQTTIQPYFSCYDPLSYPLFFPNGEPGWHSGIPRRGVLSNQLQPNHNTIDDDMDETAPAVKHNNKRKTPSVTKPSPRESDPQADSQTKHVKTTPSATSMNHTTNQPNTNQDAIATASEAENKRVDQEKKIDDWEDDEWWSTNIQEIIDACTPPNTK